MYLKSNDSKLNNANTPTRVVNILKMDSKEKKATTMKKKTTVIGLRKVNIEISDDLFGVTLFFIILFDASTDDVKTIIFHKVQIGLDF